MDSEEREWSAARNPLHGFLEAAPDAIVVVDLDGRIISVNHLTEEMFGYPREALIGEAVELLVPERYRVQHVAHRRGYSRDPHTRPMGEGQELAGRRRDGSEFPVEISLSPLETEQGRVVISIIRDITLRKQADASFKALLESAPDGIVVVDATGVIVIANTQAERIFGYARGELLGEPIELLVPERSRVDHVGLRTGYSRDPHTRPMGEGRELSGRRKDGSEVPVEISLSPLKTDRETLVISIVRDTTQRRQAEAKFRGLLESAPDGIVVVDATGVIVIVNTQAERLFGYTREELIGERVEILVPDRYRSSHVPFRTGYFDSPTTRPMGAGRQLTGRKRDGSEFPVEISLSPLETEHGTLVTSIVRDITERRAAEEHMKASLREKEVLLKEIHHRVKNNLQVTSSLLKLQSNAIQDPHARELFAESQNRIRSMALVHERLYQSSDLSRIDFLEYVESLARLLFRSFGAAGRRITLEVGGERVFLAIDTAVPCGLIVNELVSNSLKHAFPDERAGRVEIQVHTGEPGSFTLSIHDDGVGLPARFDLATTDTLGLQLVQTLVEQLRAEVEVVREGGTTFRVHFGEVRA